MFDSMIRSYMKYNTVIYGFYPTKKGIDFGKSLFVLEGICFSEKIRLDISCKFSARQIRLETPSPIFFER